MIGSRLKLLLAARSGAITPPPPYDYLVHTPADLTAALGLYGSAGGATIMIAADAVMAPGYTFTDLKPAAELKIVGQSITRPFVDLSGITLIRCENLTLNYLDFGFDDNRTMHSVIIDGPSNKIKIQFNEMHGQTLNPPPRGSVPRYPDGYDDYGYSPGGDTGAPGQIPDGITGPGKPTNYGVKYQDNYGKGALTNSVVSDNYFHDLNSGFRPRLGVGMVVENNILDMIYTDGISPGVSPEFNPHGLLLRFNHIMRRVCLYDDYGNPHGDAIQFSGGNPTTNFVCDGITIEGNFTWDMPDARGNYQGILAQDMKNNTTPADPDDGGRFRYMKIAHNLRVALGGDGQGINITSVEGSYVFGNRVLCQDPDAFASEVATIALYGQAGWMKNYVGYNVAENLANRYGQSEGNVTVASTLAGYNTVVDGPTYNPTTAAEAMAMFEFKFGGALSALRGKVDYVARTIDRTVERPWIGWDTKLDVAVGSSQESGFRILLGGGPNQAFTANTEYNIANDASGTGATGWLPAGSGLIDEGKFVNVRRNASASGSATVTADFVVRGYSNLFRIISASAANFVAADNQDAAYSRVTTQPLVTGANLGIGVFAMEFMLDNHASNDVLWEAGSSTSTLMIPSTNQYRFQKRSNGSRFVSVNTVAHSVWQRMSIFYDLFADGQDAIKAWYINGVPQEFTTSHAAQPTGETPAQAFGSTGMTLLASAAGTAISDAKFRMLFMHETAAGGFSWPADMLDGGAMHAAFSGDNIGADGSGPLGFQPQWFFTPDVGLTAMNSTLVNKGSISGKDFDKQAGTYV